MQAGHPSDDATPLTLGTAGHIDHGKTALVLALTGKDTDRLPEEKARGISIELGYAPLSLGSRRLSVVDVPGHERFVRTMVAGATGIDLYLMVVAADDGVMPQTREHAAVLAALGVDEGVVAVTKTDLADPARAAAEARELLPEAEIVPVSSRTGAGLDELRAALSRAAARVALARRRRSAAPARRPRLQRSAAPAPSSRERCGRGWRRRARSVTVLPSGKAARVRGVQVHDEPVERAQAGQRVALNLAGVDRDEVARGDVIVEAADRWRPPTASTSRSRGPRPTRGPTAARGSASITARASRRRGSSSSAGGSSSCASRSRSSPPPATGS